MVRLLCAADRRLSEVLPHAQLFGSRDVRLASCTSDARRVRPGDIYVALVDRSGDGHFEAEEAIARGASAVIAERMLPVSVPVYVVEDTREAFGQVCQQVVGAPSQRLCTIGVTGSHGKTTTALLLAAILRAAGHTTGWATSLGTSNGRGVRERSCDDWHPPEFARRLAGWEAGGCEAAVLELPSSSLAERRAAGIAFDAAILTNIRHGDLRLHRTAENYRQALLRIFGQLKNGGLAVVNADDPATRRCLEQLGRDPLPGRLLSIGIESPADISAQVMERYVSEQTFMMSAGDEVVPVRTALPGDYHVLNCLAAAAVGLSLGIDLPTVVRGIESVTMLPGRMQRVECGQPFGVFVDAANDPDRLSAALHALRRVTRGRLICVYGPDGRAPRTWRPLLGRAVERAGAYGIVTANNPGLERIERITDDVVDGYQRAARAHVIPDRRRAIQFALGMARAGDTVLIAGKGNSTGQILARRTEAFDDVAEVYAHFSSTSLPPVAAEDSDEPVILRMY